MTLEERVTKSEKRIDILDASEARAYRLLDEQLTILTNEVITNIRLMREHFESHYLDKKKKEEYTSKRKTIYKEYTNE